jgi:hypothetical protein
LLLFPFLLLRLLLLLLLPSPNSADGATDNRPFLSAFTHFTIQGADSRSDSRPSGGSAA